MVKLLEQTNMCKCGEADTRFALDLEIITLKKQIESDAAKNAAISNLLSKHESLLIELHKYQLNGDNDTKLKLIYDELVTLYKPLLNTK